ncbi:MAG: [FeFe] hydrogenase H-cluster radical SAM maturase HydG [Hyphomonadaceae bacterium]|nr:[FeFe] hydrogenase H-cluster radical SAM maturase HydG [Clostridia bacterium]
MFNNEQYIEGLLEQAVEATNAQIIKVLQKAKTKKGLTPEEIATLLYIKDPMQLQELYDIAGQIKQSIYGNRIVVFAPLYVSNYCVNNCTYCGYKRDNKIARRKLTREEIQQEVQILEKMGHKRLALECGEDPVNCDLDYILSCIDAVYSTKSDNGAIRRLNVNVAATTVENYRKLKGADIGTYILFQETYHRKTYHDMHPNCLKGDYEYHLTAFDRAMEGGLDDVGAGVLFGLYDAKYEVLAMMLHNAHLEEKFGVGFHTISVPRLKKAEGMDLSTYPHLLEDEEFKKIVAILRLAVPYTGIILSTRESAEMREQLIRYGVSQVSAGSCTGVGGYKENESCQDVGQFEVADQRTPIQILKSLMSDGHLPSYCTACYRQGRTGDRFMQLAKSGKIQHVCQPNAIMTLMEFLLDYGDEALYQQGSALIAQEVEKIERQDIKALVIENLQKIRNGERDLYL